MISGKKILILSHTPSISNFKIGSHHYANQLARAGHNVTFMGTPFSLMHKLTGKKCVGLVQINDSVRIDEFKFIFPITTKRNWLFIFVNKITDFLIRMAQGRKSRYDIIICDYPFFEPYINVFKYKKIIYRPTDNYSTMSGIKVLTYEKKLIAKADAVIATSNEVAEFLSEKNKLNKDIKVINNGYDAEFFFSDDSIEKKGAIYIGAIDYRFDIKAMECLASNFKNDVFDIYGPISTEMEIEIKRIESEHSNIKFHGPISYNKTAEKLRQAKVGLLPLNDSDANKGRSPMKLWEYAASGLNVLYRGVNLDYKKDVSFLYEYADYDDLLLMYKNAYSADFTKSNQDMVEKQSWVEKTNELQDIIKEIFNGK
ncbi:MULTISPECIES: glycosyltransferase [Serratia]|uniref:glycosyltransferase n=1 Tax=Serratia TaxID=613 RepID=UPI000B785C6C|nr:glycosyltransferase [Serratia marcescens]MBL0901790.1 glycosyltransferase [Serratia bockelmannii]